MFVLLQNDQYLRTMNTHLIFRRHLIYQTAQQTARSETKLERENPVLAGLAIIVAEFFTFRKIIVIFSSLKFCFTIFKTSWDCCEKGKLKRPREKLFYSLLFLLPFLLGPTPAPYTHTL